MKDFPTSSGRATYHELAHFAAFATAFDAAHDGPGAFQSTLPIGHSYVEYRIKLRSTSPPMVSRSGMAAFGWPRSSDAPSLIKT